MVAMPSKRLLKLSLTFASSSAVSPQLVPGIIRRKCTPPLTTTISSAAVVITPAILEREHAAVTLRRTLSASP